MRLPKFLDKFTRENVDTMLLLADHEAADSSDIRHARVANVPAIKTDDRIDIVDVASLAVQPRLAHSLHFSTPRLRKNLMFHEQSIEFDQKTAPKDGTIDIKDGYGSLFHTASVACSAAFDKYHEYSTLRGRSFYTRQFSSEVI